MIAPATPGVQGALSRIAAIESQIGMARAAGAAPAVGQEGGFADSLSRAGADAGSSPSPGPAAPSVSAAGGTSAMTIGVAARGAGNVRGLSALAPAAPPPSTLTGAPAARPVAPGSAVREATPVSAPAQDATGGAAGTRAVALAKQHLGVPYVWGGEDPSGFDCSGLVQYTFKRLGVDLPRVSRDQAKAGRPVASLAQARPGDLVAFGSPVDHIGIYAGDNKMVAAPYTGANVRVQDITRPITAIRRVV